VAEHRPLAHHHLKALSGHFCKQAFDQTRPPERRMKTPFSRASRYFQGVKTSLVSGAAAVAGALQTKGVA
jgi:hypothetical protein